jgi:hypothetical protein
MQLPPAALADMPFKDRAIFLDDLKKDQPKNKRLDIRNDYMEFYSDGETPFYASSMLYLKVFWIKGGGFLVFCHMPKPQADGGAPRPGQTFVFKREDGTWNDVTREYIPAEIDILSRFVPRRSKNIVQVGTYRKMLVLSGGGHDYVRQCDLYWTGRSFVVRKSPSQEFSYDAL